MNTASFKLSDEQVANIITKSCELVAEDARPVMVTHMYQLAYTFNENGNSSLFVSEVEKFLRRIVGN